MARDATRRAVITVGLNDRQLGRDLDAAKRKVRKGSDDLARRISGGGGAKKRSGFGFGAAAGVGMKAFDSVTGFVTGAISDVFNFEKALVRLQIASGKSNEDMAKLRTAIRETSRQTGIAASEILQGTQSYVDLTGDIAGAEAAMSSFARIAQASGSSVSDVAAAAAALKQSLGIDTSELEARFSGFITQGKKGAVALKDFAKELAALAPRWAKFNEGTTDAGIAQFGAAFQVARQGFGSASEAATGLEALMGALVQHAAKFQAAGVKIFEKTMVNGKPVKVLRTFEQILQSIEKSRLVRDPTLMTQALGSKEAEQTISMLLRARQEVTATGNAYTDLVEAGKDAGAVQRDLTTFLESSAGKLELSMNRMKEAIASAFTPERIEKFAQILEQVARLVERIAKSGKVFSILGGGAVPDIVEDVARAAESPEGQRELGRKDAAREAADLEARADKMTPAEREAAVQRAAADADAARAKGDHAKEAFHREQQRQLTGRSELGTDVNAITRELVKALAGVKIEIKADGTAIARTVANAPVQKQPRRG